MGELINDNNPRPGLEVCGTDRGIEYGQVVVVAPYDQAEGGRGSRHLSNCRIVFCCILLDAPIYKRCTPRPSLTAERGRSLVFLDGGSTVLVLFVFLCANFMPGNLNEVVDVTHDSSSPWRVIAALKLESLCSRASLQHQLRYQCSGLVARDGCSRS